MWMGRGAVAARKHRRKARGTRGKRRPSPRPWPPAPARVCAVL